VAQRESENIELNKKGESKVWVLKSPQALSVHDRWLGAWRPYEQNEDYAKNLYVSESCQGLIATKPFHPVRCWMGEYLYHFIQKGIIINKIWVKHETWTPYDVDAYKLQPPTFDEQMISLG
jgi:hypothetical protein